MKSVRGQTQDDYSNNKECERTLYCKLSSEIIAFLQQTIEADELFLKILVNIKHGMTENFIEILNRYKIYLPYFAEYFHQISKPKDHQIKPIFEDMNVSDQMKNEIRNILKRLQLSFKKVMSEESHKFETFEKEALKCIKEIQKFMKNFDKIDENYKIFESIINECNEINSKILNKDFNHAKIQIKQIFLKLQELSKDSNIEKKIKNKIILLKSRLRNILQSFSKMDVSAEIQQFIIDIKSLYIDMMNIEINNSYPTPQEINFLEKHEIIDFETLINDVVKCMDAFHHFIEVLKQEITSDYKGKESIFESKKIHEHLIETAPNMILNETKETFFENTTDKAQNLIKDVLRNYENKIDSFESELQKITNETRHFYEFMMSESMFVRVNQINSIAQTNYEIENFIKEIKECLQVLTVYNQDALAIQFMKQMIDDVEKFYDKTIKCEISGEIMPRSEFLQFMKKIEELNEGFIIIESSKESSIYYDYLIANDEANLKNEILNNSNSYQNQQNRSLTESSTNFSNDNPMSQSDDSFSLDDFEIFMKNFNESSCTHADMENLQQKISELIILRQKISGTNMQMKVDKLVKRGKHLLERTQENYLKNYTRLQQLMNIVKEKMSEELVYRGDIEALDKHVVEINALLPRMEANYQIATSSALKTYEDYKKIMQERNTAMIRLEKIAVELKEGNFTVENNRIKNDIEQIVEIFKNTNYSKIVEVIFNKVNFIMKANEILNIADQILAAPDDDFQSNLEQIYLVKEKIYVILHATKNILTRLRAEKLYQKLIARLQIHESIIMEKLNGINLSNLEVFNLEQLLTLSENLKIIAKTVKNKQILIKINKLLKQIKSMRKSLAEIIDEMDFIEKNLNMPLDENELNQLESYLIVLSDLELFKESSIVSKARELGRSIRKLIYDYQVKHELQEINRELINIEQAQTGSNINDNIMRLQNLEIKIEEIEADDKTEDDVQEVLDNIHIHQMRQEIVREKGIRVLKSIVAETITIIRHTLSQIEDFDRKLTQLDQSNENQLEIIKMLSYETYNIEQHIGMIGEELASIVLSPIDKNGTEIIAENNSVQVLIRQLLNLDYLYNDSQINSLYESVIIDLKEFEQVQIRFELILKEFNEKTSTSRSLDDNNESFELSTTTENEIDPLQ